MIPMRPRRLTWRDRVRVLMGKSDEDKAFMRKQIAEMERLWCYQYHILYSGGHYIVRDGEIVDHAEYPNPEVLNGS